MKILDQLAVQILREFGISSFSPPGFRDLLFFFTGSRDQNPSYPHQQYGTFEWTFTHERQLGSTLPPLDYLQGAFFIE